MNQAGGLAEVPAYRAARRPDIRINPQREPLRGNSKVRERLDHGCAGCADDGRGPQDYRLPQPSSPAESTAIRDLAQSHQLASGDVNEAWQMEDPGRCHGNETGSAGPD